MPSKCQERAGASALS